MANDSLSEVPARIIATVSRVPRGKVATYGQIARLAGFPRNARQVGAVLKQLPEDSNVPWHRIVNASGRVSRRNGQAQHLQRVLLEGEGIEFSDSGRLSFARYLWRKASDANLS